MALPSEPGTHTDDSQSGACYYTVLGLQPGATGQEIKQSARDLMKLYHPDKGHGDTQRIIQVHEAMLALTGRALGAEDYGARQLLVAPKEDEKYVDMTIGELQQLSK